MINTPFIRHHYTLPLGKPDPLATPKKELEPELILPTSATDKLQDFRQIT